MSIQFFPIIKLSRRALQTQLAFHVFLEESRAFGHVRSLPINDVICCILQTKLAFHVFLEEAKAFYLTLAVKLQQRWGDAGLPAGEAWHKAVLVCCFCCVCCRSGCFCCRRCRYPCCCCLAALRLQGHGTAAVGHYSKPGPTRPTQSPMLPALAAQQLQAMGRELPAALPPAARRVDCAASVHRCLVCLGDLCR